MTTYSPGQLYTGAEGDLLFVILPGGDVEFVTNRGTRVAVAEAERVYAPLTLVRDVFVFDDPEPAPDPVAPLEPAADTRWRNQIATHSGHRVEIHDTAGLLTARGVLEGVTVIDAVRLADVEVGRETVPLAEISRVRRLPSWGGEGRG